MTNDPAPWTASVTVRADDPALVRWLEQALRPESAREVPRSSADVRREGDRSVTIAITARDSGAMRAALNTYLGWVHLSLATARAAAASGAAKPSRG